MMIFGQGAIRCHPFIQTEMNAVQQNDLARFDYAFFQHIGFFLHNLCASFWLGISHAYFQQAPGNQVTKRYYQQIAKLSCHFALITDYALLTLGGALKRKERLSGRFADALSNLYLCSCVLKHHHNQGFPEADTPMAHWACLQTLNQAQQALWDICHQLPIRPLAVLLRTLSFPFGKSALSASDSLIAQVAGLLLSDTAARDRLTQGIYINTDPHDATGRIEAAFKAVLAAAPVEAKLRAAQKQKLLAKGPASTLINDAISKHIISKVEAKLLSAAETARLAAISVDDFDPNEL
jgi:acyl-CoA dehydrogenase